MVGVVLLVRRGEWARRRWQVFILSAPVGLLSPLATFGDPRFKMPIYPVLAICAGVAVAALFDRRSEPAEGDTGTDAEGTDPAGDDEGDSAPAPELAGDRTA